MRRIYQISRAHFYSCCGTAGEPPSFRKDGVSIAAVADQRGTPALLHAGSGSLPDWRQPVKEVLKDQRIRVLLAETQPSVDDAGGNFEQESETERNPSSGGLGKKAKTKRTQADKCTLCTCISPKARLVTLAR